VSELLRSDDSSESLDSAAFIAACWAASILGAFWRYVRISSVAFPRPIEVK
jgi:hypothetical protein